MEENRDINSMVSDDAVMVDALVMKNKILLVQNAQLSAEIKRLLDENQSLLEANDVKGKKSKVKK